MKIVELIIDENDEFNGVEAISIVENPAIEEDFIALKDNKPVALAEVDKEKKILMGALLVPNKPIFRKTGEEEYYIFFSKETILKASQKYLKSGNQKNSTLEHEMNIQGLTLVESWIKEDMVHDKSVKYGMDVPVGSWLGTIKVDNDEIWNNYVKTGLVKGFSIEGYFADKAESPKDKGIKDEFTNQLKDLEFEYEEEPDLLLEELKKLLSGEELKSYTDYPDAVKNNAQRGIDLNKKVNNKCATQVGKVRASQLASGKPITESTIKRMYSFLSRAETYYDEKDTSACGTISYLLWGGKAGLRWAESKMKDLKLYSQKVNDDYAIILDRLAYSSKEMAEKIAKDIGCDGIHEHDFQDQTWYMPCKQHALTEEEFKKYKCPKGYKKDYKKHKCVKMTEEELAEVGKRGGIKKSPKAPKSGTKNPNPKGKGTAKGDAKTSRGAKVDKKTEATLQKKADDFNKRYKDKLGYGVTIGQLKAVFQRGLGAFNTSRSPRVTSAKQWGLSRVNAYLYLVKNGRPQNAKYKTDNDLLPKKHPKSNK
jgi:hypothetical protein